MDSGDWMLDIVRHLCDPRAMKRGIPICGASLFRAVVVFMLLAVASVAHARVGDGAVWNPGEETIQRTRDACADAEDVAKCFALAMKREGASRQAVKFARSLPTFGILRELKDTGKVDIAYVLYPFRANENYGVLLVNGRPSPIDVDDLSLLPLDQIETDLAYPDLVKRYGQLSLWPADRFNTNVPSVEVPKGGGEWFAVDYRVTDGCRACEDIGIARFGFDFDEKGRFLGAKFIRLVPRGKR